MKYDDLQRLEDFEKGIYPKIHDDIFKLVSETDGHSVLDVGCCYGLLSNRLSKSFDVVGIEQNKEYCKKSVYDKVVNMKISEDTLDDLRDIIKQNHIDIVVCRRVIPEMYTGGGEKLILDFADVLYECGVQYIVLEGRIKSKKSVHRLKGVDEEIEILNRNYLLDARYKNCARLKRKRGKYHE